MAAGLERRVEQLETAAGGVGPLLVCFAWQRDGGEIVSATFGGEKFDRLDDETEAQFEARLTRHVGQTQRRTVVFVSQVDERL